MYAKTAHRCFLMFFCIFLNKLKYFLENNKKTTRKLIKYNITNVDVIVRERIMQKITKYIYHSSTHFIIHYNRNTGNQILTMAVEVAVVVE